MGNNGFGHDFIGKMKKIITLVTKNSRQSICTYALAPAKSGVGCIYALAVHIIPGTGGAFSMGCANNQDSQARYSYGNCLDRPGYAACCGIAGLSAFNTLTTTSIPGRLSSRIRDGKACPRYIIE